MDLFIVLMIALPAILFGIISLAPVTFSEKDLDTLVFKHD